MIYQCIPVLIANLNLIRVYAGMHTHMEVRGQVVGVSSIIFQYVSLGSKSVTLNICTFKISLFIFELFNIVI